LAKRPDLAEKIRKEADIAFSKNEPGIQTLNDLDYTKRFISEVLRLYPPVPIFGRSALSDDEWNGFKIPKGMLVITSPFVIHRNPKYWPDPEKIDPDRHLPENSKKRIPFAYFPYGGGPRICLGMGYAQIQLPLTIAYLIRHFNFSLVENYKLKLSPAITIGTKDPILVNVSKIKS
jgi:cytochrome P450